MKRIGLFLITNLAIVVVLGVALNILLPMLGLTTRDTGGLLVLALVFGMGGSFISLMMSKWIAKRATGAQVIERPRNEIEQWLMETVKRQAQQAGIGMPEVAIYQSPDINAFATGANRNNALVAVSTGLLNGMTRDEAEAVLGHEVTHVANGDMVTLALIQGVVNTFVIFLARVVGGMIDSALRGNQQSSGPGLAYFGIVIVLEILFGILASVVVMYFSRQREFRADVGGARFAGREKMIAALERLRRSTEPSHLPEQMAAFGINGRGSKLAQLFSSHPPLEQRIAALRNAG